MVRQTRVAVWDGSTPAWIGAIVQSSSAKIGSNHPMLLQMERVMKLDINNSIQDIDAQWQDESLLDVLREKIGLTGTRFGCGQGTCGACTVLVDGVAVRSCVLSARMLQGRSIVTIEGLANPDGRLHVLQQAWVDGQVAQCGYCQSGQIMAAAALLRRTPRPNDAQIDAALAGNLCRCGTQQRIRRAVHRAANMLS
ncbi:MAG: (2Fe-2S)-binding protein [Pseudomonadota bacterium]